MPFLCSLTCHSGSICKQTETMPPVSHKRSNYIKDTKHKNQDIINVLFLFKLIRKRQKEL